MSKQHKIEFIDGEPFCRYDGILCDPEGCKTIYGYDDEIAYLDTESIVMKDTLYTDDDLATVIKAMAEHQGKTDDYDMAVNEGYGLGRWCERIKHDNTYLLRDGDLMYFNNIRKIKPFAEFANDYPEIDLEKYNEFQDTISAYYDSLRIQE